MLKEQQYIRQLEVFFPGDSRNTLEAALEHARYLYDSLYRYNGETYFLRSVRLTAEKLIKYSPDQTAILASILISAVYSPRCDLTKIEQLFGSEVRAIVESLGKINSIKSRYSTSDTTVIRQMFLTLAYDIRTIIIRLLERIDNLETLDFKSPEKQKANAKEILDVYVPIASRLGFYEIITKLEDIAFKYVYPREYAILEQDLKQYLSKSKRSMDDVKQQLTKLCLELGYEVEVSGRIKHLFSIFKKLKKKNRQLDEIYDIYAMRLVLKTGEGPINNAADIEKIYALLAELNKRYESLPDRYKDYVAKPKSNGYQSLHLAIVGLHSDDRAKPTEVQIRTDKMHRQAEYGMAAHWVYKENTQDDEVEIQLLNEKKKSVVFHDSADKMRSLMRNWEDKIFVMTPDSLVKELPSGSTSIDLAYALDAALGHSCVGVKINGVAKPLDYELRNGDVVEIVTGNVPNPKLSWLGFVVTQNARNRIKSFYSTKENEDLYAQGLTDMNKLLEQVRFPLLTDNLDFLANYNGRALSYEQRHELLEDIGAGVISPSEVFEGVYGKAPELVIYGERQKEENRFRILQAGLSRKKGLQGQSASLLIGGEADIPYKISSCCKPELRDQLIAYMTRSKGISLHKATCKFLKSVQKSRLLEVKLINNQAVSENRERLQAVLLLELTDRSNFLRELIELFDRNKITVLEYSLIKKLNDIMHRRMVIDVTNENELKDAIEQMRELEGVLKVARL